MSRFISFVTIVCLALMQISSQMYAVTYPASTPFGETTGGTFRTYFDNMYTTTQCNTLTQVVGGFTASGVPICVTPVSSGFFFTGQTNGDTVRFNGTDWVRSNFLYNNGTQIGIGTQTPQATLDVSGDIRINHPSAASGRFLVSDANGIGTWTDNIPATSFSISGSVLGSTTYYNGGAWVATTNLFNTGGFIGIGTVTPQALLDVNGQIRINHPSAASGRFLVSDANGIGTWTDNIPATSFSISGQTLGATTYFDGTDWVATTNLFNTGGFIGIGTLTPEYRLDVAGSDMLVHGIRIGRGQGSILSNTVFGYNPASANVTGANNSVFGSYGLASNVSGSNNLALGVNAGSNLLSGNNNIFIGYNTQPNMGNTASDQLNIGNWIYGYAGNIGIGVVTPSAAKLEVNGQIRIAGGGVGSGRFLVSDANGVGSWTDNIPATSFSISGQTLGSTMYYNGSAWVASTNIFNTGGNVGIGTVNPSAKLEVLGSVDAVNLTGPIKFNAKGQGGSVNLYSMYDSLNSNNDKRWKIGAVAYPYIPDPAQAGDLAIEYWTGSTFTRFMTIKNSGDIGIGTMTPGAKLEIAGQVKITGGTPGLGKILTSDATGLAVWSNGFSGSVTASGIIGATGSQNYLSKFGTGGIGLFASQLFDNDTGVGVGTAAPSAKLDVVGGDARINGLTVGRGGGSNSNNSVFGNNALSANTTGNYNTANGVAALLSNTIGNNNTAIGATALYINSVGSNNTAVGQYSLRNNQGDNNTALGYFSLGYTTGGSNNTALGVFAGQNLTSGDNNIFIGYGAQPNISNTGSNQLNIGNWIYGSSGNIGIGTGTALTARLSVNGQVRITGGSPGSGKILTSDAAGLAVWSNGFSGSVTASGITGGTQNYVTKFGTGGNGLVNSLIYSTSTGVGIGTTTPGSKLEVWSGTVTLFHMRGSNNLGLGSSATRYISAGSSNVGVGNSALRSLQTGNSNVAVGEGAQYTNSDGDFNVAVGKHALYSTDVGDWNIGLGTLSLWTNRGGSYNVALGGQALYLNSSNSNNIAIGYGSLYSSTADNNIAIGHNAGSGITTGGNNILIGANIAPQLGNTVSNQLNIGNWIYGDNGRISLGRNTMSSGGYRLDVASGFVNSASGYCINGTCIPNWSGIFDAINGAGNYIPKWNATGTGLIASRLADNGIDISISSGALQQVLITPANQDQYQQVIISTGGVLKKGLTSREKLRIFAVSDYGTNDDAVTIQQLCFDTSTNAACRVSAADNPLTNVPNFNSIDSKSYTGGIGEYIPSTATRPGYFISNFTGTYMVVTSYTFSSTSFSTSDLGCNVFPYYSLYNNVASLPAIVRRDVTPPNIITINSNGAISNVYSSTNLSLPTQKTTRVGAQFVSNVFMTPGQVLLMSIGVQSCASRADRSMALVINNQKKMTLSITEL